MGTLGWTEERGRIEHRLLGADFVRAAACLTVLFHHLAHRMSWSDDLGVIEPFRVSNQIGTFGWRCSSCSAGSCWRGPRDFSYELTFSAGYKRLYDQAGAMLWVDGNNWLKTGIEFTDGALHFSVAVTRDDQSDWSVMALGGEVGAPVTLQLTRHAEALRVQIREAGGNWRLVRLAYLWMPEIMEVGPMFCSPTGEGLEVTFSRMALGEPIPRELH